MAKRRFGGVGGSVVDYVSLALSGKFKTKEEHWKYQSDSSQNLNILLVSSAYHANITTPIPTSPGSRWEHPEAYLNKQKLRRQTTR
jgi:hypothetical protein